MATETKTENYAAPARLALGILVVLVACDNMLVSFD